MVYKFYDKRASSSNTLGGTNTIEILQNKELLKELL